MTGTAALSTRRLEGVANARAEMFVAFGDELNRARIPWCLLSGYENYPEPGDSDVDFMVGQQDAARMTGLLQTVARRTGALLVQAIQHETSAWYFVLARQVGDHVAYLHPDCSTDFRRDGRRWLCCGDLLARRRKLGNVFVPAKPDEFLYYLIKKVLKQEIDEERLGRLRKLYVACPEECCERLQRFWSAKSVRCTVSALFRANVSQMRRNLPSMRAELLASPQVEGWLKRVVQRFRDWWRWVDRVMHPTGLNIAITGGTCQQLDELAEGLENNLRRAFRRTRVLDDGGLASAVWSWMARVRSTLVIRKLASPSANMFGASQVRFDLSGTPPNVEFATRVVLERMASRLSPGTDGVDVENFVVGIRV